MHFDLIKIYSEMDWMARGVTFALLAMGIISLGVALERLTAFVRSGQQSASLSALAGSLVAERQYDKLLQATEAHPASYLARLLGPALRTYLANEARASDKAAVVVELVRRELSRRQEDMTGDVRRGLNVLASVGSVAPFVGLLGTVVGIIAAFGKISVTGSGGLGSVAGGISEALVVTALGLLIAIPAVLMFNALSARADKIQQGLASSAGEFVDHIEFAPALSESSDTRSLRLVDGQNGTEAVPAS